MMQTHSPDIEKSASSTSSYYFISLIIIATIARVAALVSLKDTPYYSYLMYDEHLLHEWAAKLAKGSFNSGDAYSFAPLFPYTMSVVYKLLSADILYVRILNIIMGTAVCGIVYLITRELADRKTARVAMLIAALSEQLIFYSIVPLKASMTTLLFGIMLIFYLVWRRRGSISLLFFCGASLGLLLNLRPHALVLFPVFSIFLLFDGGGRNYKPREITANLIVFMLGGLLAVSPFILRNYLVAGTINITTTQAGFNLYRANKLPLDVPVNFAETIPRIQETQFRIEASKRVGKKLSSAEASDFWKRETIKIISSEPQSFIVNICRKTLFFFREHQLTDHYSIEFMRNHMCALQFPFVTFTLLMPLGCAGLIILALQNRRGRELLFIFIAYGATLILLFMRTRYRLPLMMILIPATSIFLMRFSSWLISRDFRQARVNGVLLVFFAFLTCYPIRQGKDDTAYLNGHALALRNAGKMITAMEYWKKSSEKGGIYSDFANLSLAQTYLRRGEVHPARKYLDKIQESSYAIAQKYLLMGEIFRKQGLTDKAVIAYQRSLSYNSGMLLPLKRLIMLYEKTEDPRKKETYNQLRYIRSFYSNSINTVLHSYR